MDSDDDFDLLPVKPRGGGALVLTDDPFDAINPLKARGNVGAVMQDESLFGDVNIPTVEDNFNDSDFDSLPVKPRGKKVVNLPTVEDNFNDSDFDCLPVKPRGMKVVSLEENSSDSSLNEHTLTKEFLECKPAVRRGKDTNKIEEIKNGKIVIALVPVKINHTFYCCCFLCYSVGKGR